MPTKANLASQKSAKAQNKKGCMIASAIGGCAALFGICALVVFFVFIFNPFEEEILSGSTPSGVYESATDASGDGIVAEFSDENYTLQRIRGAETTSEFVEGSTSLEASTLNLSDGTRLELPASASPVDVKLSRETTTLQFDQSGLETSGSTRVMEFDLQQIDASFIPQLTIPAHEMGELHPSTVNIARVGPVWVDGEILADQLTFLPLTLDSNGDILITDPDIAGLAATEAAFNNHGAAKMAALKKQYGDGRFFKVSYVPMTFQTHLDWYVHPRLVRMIADPDAPGYRRPADMTRDQNALQKPISNVIVLVHGHNEQEKDGSAPASAEAPWDFTYKQEVWNELYKTFSETQTDQMDCTAFYEFIYPSFRPAYSPVAGGVVEPLGDTFAKAMQVGAKNDGYQIKNMHEADMPLNVYIAAHSMGGLVARAGIRQFDEYMQNSFQRLVTWGTPHHGSPLVTLGYIFRGDYMVNPGKLRAAHWFPSSLPEGDVNNILGSGMLEWILDRKVQLDTPGTRDLRWDNARPLRLDEIFSDDTKALILRDAANTQYNLENGTWLYNANLKIFNDSDPYYNSDKYIFLYGTTSKRLPDQNGETAIGATILPTLLQDGSRTITDNGGDRLESESDGAVPLVSMAGMGISSARFHLGDIDHEEYYSPAGDMGIKTAQATFAGFGLDEPRCACARVLIHNLESENAGSTPGQRAIDARLILDPEFAPFPGEAIQSAEAIIYPQADVDLVETLGEFKVSESGELNAIFNVPEAGEEQMMLIVRVYLRDNTILDSEPVEFNETPCLPHPGSIINICTCNNGMKCWWNGIEAMCSDEEPPREWFCADPP